MQIKAATVLALLPFLVSAAPTPEAGLKIPLTKRSSVVKNGIVDLTAVKAQRAHLQGLVVYSL